MDEAVIDGAEGAAGRLGDERRRSLLGPFRGVGVIARVIGRLGRRSVWVLLAGMACVAGLLTVFGVVIAGSQAAGREEVEKRFRSQAVIASALVESLFVTSSASATAEASRLFSGEEIAGEELAAFAERNNNAYALVLDAEGRLLGASPGLPESVIAQATRLPAHVRAALAGTPTLSDLLPGVGELETTVEWASPFQTPHGLRVQVRGTDAAPVAAFLAVYLTQAAPDESTELLVVDGSGQVIGAKAGAESVARVDELMAALAGRSEGTFEQAGVESRFVSDPVAGSTWQLVLSQPTDDLYTPLAGEQRWIIWCLFAAFAVALPASLVFLRRALLEKRAHEHANRELAGMNESLERLVAERTAALEARAAQLGRSNAELEQFAYVASHDLQEPLRKIQAFGARLQAKYRDGLGEEGADYLQRMDAAAGRLRGLIDDLLGFSRVTSRALPFERVDLTAVAAEVVSDLEVQIEEAGATVEVGELPTIDADSAQMRQLLQNLVGNAIKFRRQDREPTVRIRGRTLDAVGVGGPLCELVVEDDGIGFEEQYGERIFAVFQRLHTRDAYPGTGIGLAICRKIVDRHGGTITASGVPGEGATFLVRLPVSQSESGAGR